MALSLESYDPKIWACEHCQDFPKWLGMTEIFQHLLPHLYASDRSSLCFLEHIGLFPTLVPPHLQFLKSGTNSLPLTGWILPCLRLPLLPAAQRALPYHPPRGGPSVTLPLSHPQSIYHHYLAGLCLCCLRFHYSIKIPRGLAIYPSCLGGRKRGRKRRKERGKQKKGRDDKDTCHLGRGFLTSAKYST